jgi:DNA-binding response OmpR family regulator
MPYRRYPNLRVLIVENDPVTGGGLAELYTRWGWRVSWATTGTAGLLKAPVFGPDVIVLDYYLPDMKGLEFVEKLGAAARAVVDLKGVPPVVAFTAAAGEEVERIKAAGLPVVRKPADPVELADVLETVVVRKGPKAAGGAVS